jgi:glycopeptide antibiotics resistance protein
MKRIRWFVQKKKELILRISKILFFMYLVLMIWQLFLGPYRSYSAVRRYNIYPFNTIINYFMNSDKFSFHIIFINLVANIVTFIPLGFFTSLLFKRLNKVITITIFSVLTVTSIEAMQFIFNVGVFDVDDIILNTLGCVIGFTFYKIIRCIIAQQKNNMPYY